MKRVILIIIGGLSIFIFTSCATVPKDCLKPSEDYLEKRQNQMRKYETTDCTTIYTAVAGVLQDLGFTLDESESKIGLVVGSKEAKAVNPGQTTAAVFLDILSAIGGTYSDYTMQADATQYVRASVITKLSIEGNTTVVRVTFQRIVFNHYGEINRLETVSEEEIYQTFFEKLSKAIFLEAHKI
jgi:hypothetical protein